LDFEKPEEVSNTRVKESITIYVKNAGVFSSNEFNTNLSEPYWKLSAKLPEQMDPDYHDDMVAFAGAIEGAVG
jgi:hypothetical protein